MPASLEPFVGEETFPAPPVKVFEVLTDVDALAAALPGLVSAERVDERTLKAVVRPGFSFLAGRIRLRLSILETIPAQGAFMRIEAQSIGASMSIESRLTLSPTADGKGAHLAWEARVFDMKGLIAMAPAGLIRAAAAKVITDGWKALRARVVG